MLEVELLDDGRAGRRIAAIPLADKPQVGESGSQAHAVVGRRSVKRKIPRSSRSEAFPERGGGKAKGYQLGVGYERKIMENVSVGLEFLRTSLEDDDYGVRAANSGTTAATNPFLLVNTAGTDFLRSDDDFEYNSFRVTAAFRF